MSCNHINNEKNNIMIKKLAKEEKGLVLIQEITNSVLNHTTPSPEKKKIHMDLKNLIVVSDIVDSLLHNHNERSTSEPSEKLIKELGIKNYTISDKGYIIEKQTVRVKGKRGVLRKMTYTNYLVYCYTEKDGLFLVNNSFLNTLNSLVKSFWK